MDNTVCLFISIGTVLALPILYKFRECLHEGDTQIIGDHKGRLKETQDCQDFIDLYLSEIMENSMHPNVHNKSSSSFKEKYLEILTDILFAAGTETTSNTLAWCFLRMVANPDIQHQIRDEIIAACEDDRLPTYSDRSKMPFTEAFLLEVQRLHTVLPLGVPHQATITTTLEGYEIPKGTVIAANLWALHHDPTIWTDPEEFKPTRFLDRDGKIVKKDEFIPFGVGRRACLGEKIAKMELFIFLTHLVRRYQFTSVAESSTLTFRGIPGITYAPPEFYVYADKVQN